VHTPRKRTVVPGRLCYWFNGIDRSSFSATPPRYRRISQPLGFGVRKLEGRSGDPSLGRPLCREENGLPDYWPYAASMSRSREPQAQGIDATP
jgi:hypothetical protein